MRELSGWLMMGYKWLIESSWSTINHPDRLQYPLIRRNGKLERASWDEAMSLVVVKAQDIRSRLSNHGIGFYTTGQLFLEEYYVLAMVGKAGLNTLHMYADQSFAYFFLSCCICP